MLAGSEPSDSIEKPAIDAIDAIQKHVEESLLFLDDEKGENKTEDQKLNTLLENPVSDDTVIQAVDDTSIDIEMDNIDKNRGETLKDSTVIIKQENINDASISHEQQKDKSDIERITTENKIETLFVKEESNTPEQMFISDIIPSLEDNSVSNSVLNEIHKNTANVIVSLEKESEISQLTDTNIESLQDNPISDSVKSEINTDNTDTYAIKSLGRSDISKQNSVSNVCNALQEDNPSSDNIMLNKPDTNAEITKVLENTTDISIDSHEGISQSDSLLVETDADVTMNYDSQEELGDNSKQIITNKITNDLQEQKSPPGSSLNKTDSDTNMDETQDGISDISQQNVEIIRTREEYNRSSEVVRDETVIDSAVNGSPKETKDISDQIDINEISNISQEDNNMLNESDTDAAMNVAQEIPEQIEIKNVRNIYQYKVKNETDTDMTIDDSQEEIIDISEVIDSKEIRLISQENLPSDNVLNKTDSDATMNYSQEEVSDMKTFNIDRCNISEKNNVSLKIELDKTDSVLHEGCGIDNMTLETSGNFEYYLESIKTEDPDKTTEDLGKTTTEDEELYQLQTLESDIEESALPDNEIQVKKEINETEQATQKSPEKELVWEIKSITHEPEQQEKTEQLEKDKEQNFTENPTKNNPLVRALSLEDVTECPPTKVPRLQPVWTTNPLNDEDKANAERDTYTDKTEKDLNKSNESTTEVSAVQTGPYIITPEVKKHLIFWMLKCGLARPKAKYMSKLVNDAKWNKAVLRMAPIPKEYRLKDVLRVIKDQTKIYEKEVIKRIKYIHIDKYDDNFNAAYIKWRDIDKVMVVKAYQILGTTKFTVDGVVKQPLFRYDDRSIIDWNERDRPILKRKDGTLEIPKCISTPSLTPVASPIATVVATSSASSVAEPVSVPEAETVAAPNNKPRRRPPPPFVNGEINWKDRKTFGLSPEFMEYYNIKPPIVCLVLVKNLDMSHSIENYHRMFSMAGDIKDMEVAPSHDEQQSLSLKIAFNHCLEAVQAISMFHEQILFGRVIGVEMGKNTVKREPLSIEGFSAVGPGIGINGSIMSNIRSNIEISKLRAIMNEQFDNFKVQINNLRQNLAGATFKLEQIKRDEEKRRSTEEKKQNEAQNKQASMDTMSAISTAIASSVQANVMGMLGIQPNQQGQNIKQNSPAPANNQPGGAPQIQNTSSAPNWIANTNTAAALPNQNLLGQTSIENAFQNLGGELYRFQNPQDPYNYYANMQQAYSQYGYTMDPNFMQANPFVQPGTCIRPGIVNAQPAPAIDTSIMPPTLLRPPTIPQTQSMPTISDPPVLSKPIPTEVKVESTTVLPSLTTTNKNVITYEIQRLPHLFNRPPPNVGNKTTSLSRFDIPPALVGQTTAAESKVSEITQPIPTVSKPAVQMAFKSQKAIIPPKVTKQAVINIKIPTVLPESGPMVVENPRTVEKNSVQKKLMKLSVKVPEKVPWISKQSRAVRRTSRSPERRRFSRSPVRRNSRSPVRRNSRSPARRNSRSPVRRNSRSPVRRRSRSAERRRGSRSPKRRMSRSPIRRRSRSPIRRRSRSPERRRNSRSPIRRISRSPVRRRSRSTDRRRSRSPKRRLSRSPKRGSRSPVRRRSRSPKRRMSKSPKRSPVRRISKSPVRLSVPPTEMKGISRSHSSELSQHAPDGVGRDKTNLNLEAATASYNYARERELANTSLIFSYLPPSVTTEDLVDKMSEIGELLEVRAFGMGKAMVVFKFRHDAEKCIEMYNMAKVDGQTIGLRWASIE